MALGFAAISTTAVSLNSMMLIVIDGSGGAIGGGSAVVQCSNETEDGASIIIYLTGATYDGELQPLQTASLGGHRSGTVANRVGVLESAACPNIDILDSSHQIGIGNVTALGGISVAYTGPGATIGQPVSPLVGMPVTLQDSLGQWVIVSRTTSDKITGLGAAEFHEQLNNVFGATNGTVAGESTYRAVMLRNNSLFPVTNLKLWVNPIGESSCLQPIVGTGAGTLWGTFNSWPYAGFVRITNQAGTLTEIIYYSNRTEQSLTVPSLGRGLFGTTAQQGNFTDNLACVPPIQIALETPVSGAIQTIGSETTSPSGLTFSTATSNNITVSSLASYAFVGLWINRVIPAGITAFPEFSVNIGMSFTQMGVTYNDEIVGLFRVSDATLDRYEVSWGTTPPDLTQPANETFTSFPYTTTHAFSDGTYYFSTNKRNTFNLASENTNFEVITVSGGNIINQPPSPPIATLNATSSGAFEVTGIYFDLTDNPPANEFHLYISFDGTNPLLQTPITVAMRDLGPYMFMDYVSATHTIGTTAKIVLRTFRTSDSMESTNTNELSVTSETTDFGTPILKGFYRSVAEQHQ